MCSFAASRGGRESAVTLPDTPIIPAEDGFRGCWRASERAEIVRHALNRRANDVYKWPDLMHC